MLWVATSCDLCKSDAFTLEASALDEAGLPMLGRSHPYTKLDTGKHILLCEECAEAVREANVRMQRGEDPRWSDLSL